MPILVYQFYATSEVKKIEIWLRHILSGKSEGDRLSITIYLLPPPRNGSFLDNAVTIDKKWRTWEKAKPVKNGFLFKQRAIFKVKKLLSDRYSTVG